MIHGKLLTASVATVAVLLWLSIARLVRAADAAPAAPEGLAAAVEKLPLLTTDLARPSGGDWLVTPMQPKAGVYRTARGNEIVLANGLISRTFRITPNGATVGLDNLATGQSMLRGVKPEASITVDGKTYAVGGLNGQPNYAYLLPEWLEKMTADPAAFQLTGIETGAVLPRLEWKRVRYSGETTWPPPGVSLTLQFKSPANMLQPMTVLVHYQMYDGIPLMAKWLTINNDGTNPVRLQKFTSEILAVVEGESAVEHSEGSALPAVHVEGDYAFNGSDARGANKTAYWVPDPQYRTQVSYRRTTPCLLECRPPLGPDQTIEPGKSLQTFRSFELVYDSSDRERRGLALRRMYRLLAPWATENPIMMHVISVDPKVVKAAIDQCADVGFEMVILSFGSGLNMENASPANIAKMKDLADYARGKGVELGGYSLLASRSINAEQDAINPKTGKPGGAIFDNSPCLVSQWGLDYFTKLQAFIAGTGFGLLEHDGSYPGDVCASTKHPGHRGLEDSQWNQWSKISQLYRWCRSTGVYLNVPDWYYLAGANKSAMGYREDNWSLPRQQQIIHGRQNIYDGTWEKTPSMGWMFVPLTQYHGGGAAATIEPLAEHLDAYEAHLANNFGSGVQACYRGFRLYDAPQTRAVLKKWVDFYKKHRPILDSDIIHIRRADGRDIDCMMHVNPRLKEKGLVMVFNPLDQKVTRTLRLPLYYTGLSDKAMIRQQDSDARVYKLDRRYEVEIQVQMEPNAVTWFIIESELQ